MKAGSIKVGTIMFVDSVMLDVKIVVVPLIIAVNVKEHKEMLQHVYKLKNSLKNSF